MSGSDNPGMASLKSQGAELVKQYLVYDGVNRVTQVYSAHYRATDGTPCTLVTYEYRDATSRQVSKMRESMSTWDASYDI